MMNLMEFERLKNEEFARMFLELKQFGFKTSKAFALVEEMGFDKSLGTIQKFARIVTARNIRLQQENSTRAEVSLGSDLSYICVGCKRRKRVLN
jgi:hypothetical protein